jgi:hypothetical protein
VSLAAGGSDLRCNAKPLAQNYARRQVFVTADARGNGGTWGDSLR